MLLELLVQQELRAPTVRTALMGLPEQPAQRVRKALQARREQLAPTERTVRTAPMELPAQQEHLVPTERMALTARRVRQDQQGFKALPELWVRPVVPVLPEQRALPEPLEPRA